MGRGEKVILKSKEEVQAKKKITVKKRDEVLLKRRTGYDRSTTSGYDRPASSYEMKGYVKNYDKKSWNSGNWDANDSNDKYDGKYERRYDENDGSCRHSKYDKDRKKNKKFSHHRDHDINKSNKSDNIKDEIDGEKSKKDNYFSPSSRDKDTSPPQKKSTIIASDQDGYNNSLFSNRSNYPDNDRSIDPQSTTILLVDHHPVKLESSPKIDDISPVKLDDISPRNKSRNKSLRDRSGPTPTREIVKESKEYSNYGNQNKEDSNDERNDKRERNEKHFEIKESNKSVEKKLKKYKREKKEKKNRKGSNESLKDDHTRFMEDTTSQVGKSGGSTSQVGKGNSVDGGNSVDLLYQGMENPSKDSRPRTERASTALIEKKKMLIVWILETECQKLLMHPNDRNNKESSKANNSNRKSTLGQEETGSSEIDLSILVKLANECMRRIRELGHFVQDEIELLIPKRPQRGTSDNRNPQWLKEQETNHPEYIRLVEEEGRDPNKDYEIFEKFRDENLLYYRKVVFRGVPQEHKDLVFSELFEHVDHCWDSEGNVLKSLTDGIHNKVQPQKDANPFRDYQEQQPNCNNNHRNQDENTMNHDGNMNQDGNPGGSCIAKAKSEAKSTKAQSPTRKAMLLSDPKLDVQTREEAIEKQLTADLAAAMDEINGSLNYSKAAAPAGTNGNSKRHYNSNPTLGGSVPPVSRGQSGSIGSRGRREAILLKSNNHRNKSKKNDEKNKNKNNRNRNISKRSRSRGSRRGGRRELMRGRRSPKSFTLSRHHSKGDEKKRGRGNRDHKRGRDSRNGKESSSKPSKLNLVPNAKSQNAERAKISKIADAKNGDKNQNGRNNRVKNNIGNNINSADSTNLGGKGKNTVNSGEGRKPTTANDKKNEKKPTVNNEKFKEKVMNAVPHEPVGRPKTHVEMAIELAAQRKKERLAAGEVLSESSSYDEISDQEDFFRGVAGIRGRDTKNSRGVLSGRPTPPHSCRGSLGVKKNVGKNHGGKGDYRDGVGNDIIINRNTALSTTLSSAGGGKKTNTDEVWLNLKVQPLTVAQQQLGFSGKLQRSDLWTHLELLVMKNSPVKSQVDKFVYSDRHTIRRIIEWPVELIGLLMGKSQSRLLELSREENCMVTLCDMKSSLALYDEKKDNNDIKDSKDNKITDEDRRRDVRKMLQVDKYYFNTDITELACLHRLYLDSSTNQKKDNNELLQTKLIKDVMPESLRYQLADKLRSHIDPVVDESFRTLAQLVNAHGIIDAGPGMNFIGKPFSRKSKVDSNITTNNTGSSSKGDKMKNGKILGNNDNMKGIGKNGINSKAMKGSIVMNSNAINNPISNAVSMKGNMNTMQGNMGANNMVGTTMHGNGTIGGNVTIMGGMNSGMNDGIWNGIPDMNPNINNGKMVSKKGNGAMKGGLISGGYGKDGTMMKGTMKGPDDGIIGKDGMIKGPIEKGFGGGDKSCDKSFLGKDGTGKGMMSKDAKGKDSSAGASGVNGTNGTIASDGNIVTEDANAVEGGDVNAIEVGEISDNAAHKIANSFKADPNNPFQTGDIDPLAELQGPGDDNSGGEGILVKENYVNYGEGSGAEGSGAANYSGAESEWKEGANYSGAESEWKEDWRQDENGVWTSAEGIEWHEAEWKQEGGVMDGSESGIEWKEGSGNIEGSAHAGMEASGMDGGSAHDGSGLDVEAPYDEQQQYEQGSYEGAHEAAVQFSQSANAASSSAFHSAMPSFEDAMDSPGLQMNPIVCPAGLQADPIQNVAANTCPAAQKNNSDPAQSETVAGSCQGAVSTSSNVEPPAVPAPTVIVDVAPAQAAEAIESVLEERQTVKNEGVTAPAADSNAIAEPIADGNTVLPAPPDVESGTETTIVTTATMGQAILFEGQHNASNSTSDSDSGSNSDSSSSSSDSSDDNRKRKKRKVVPPQHQLSMGGKSMPGKGNNMIGMMIPGNMVPQPGMGMNPLMGGKMGNQMGNNHMNHQMMHGNHMNHQMMHGNHAQIGGENHIMGNFPNTIMGNPNMNQNIMGNPHSMMGGGNHMDIPPGMPPGGHKGSTMGSMQHGNHMGMNQNQFGGNQMMGGKMGNPMGMIGQISHMNPNNIPLGGGANGGGIMPGMMGGGGKPPGIILGHQMMSNQKMPDQQNQGMGKQFGQLSSGNNSMMQQQAQLAQQHEEHQLQEQAQRQAQRQMSKMSSTSSKPPKRSSPQIQQHSPEMMIGESPFDLPEPSTKMNNEEDDENHLFEGDTVMEKLTDEKFREICPHFIETENRKKYNEFCLVCIEGDHIQNVLNVIKRIQNLLKWQKSHPKNQIKSSFFLEVPNEYLHKVIGSKGDTIREIRARCNADILIEQHSNNSTPASISIKCESGVLAELAKNTIEDIVNQCSKGNYLGLYGTIIGPSPDPSMVSHMQYQTSVGKGLIKPNKGQNPVLNGVPIGNANGTGRETTNYNYNTHGNGNSTHGNSTHHHGIGNSTHHHGNSEGHAAMDIEKNNINLTSCINSSNIIVGPTAIPGFPGYVPPGKGGKGKGLSSKAIVWPMLNNKGPLLKVGDSNNTFNYKGGTYPPPGGSMFPPSGEGGSTSVQGLPLPPPGISHHPPGTGAPPHHAATTRHGEQPPYGAPGPSPVAQGGHHHPGAPGPSPAAHGTHHPGGPMGQNYHGPHHGFPPHNQHGAPPPGQHGQAHNGPPGLPPSQPLHNHSLPPPPHGIGTTMGLAPPHAPHNQQSHGLPLPGSHIIKSGHAPHHAMAPPPSSTSSSIGSLAPTSNYNGTIGSSIGTSGAVSKPKSAPPLTFNQLAQHENHQHQQHKAQVSMQSKPPTTFLSTSEQAVSSSTATAFSSSTAQQQGRTPRAAANNKATSKVESKVEFTNKELTDQLDYDDL